MFWQAMSSPQGNGQKKRRQPEAHFETAPAQATSRNLKPCVGFIARTLFEAQREDDKEPLKEERNGTHLPFADGLNSPCEDSSATSRIPSAARVTPASLFEVSRRTPPPTTFAANAGPGTLSAPGKPTTPSYNPICFGFFAKTTPSPQRAPWPNCISPNRNAPLRRPVSPAVLQKDEAAELRTLLRAAQREGAVIMTSSSSSPDSM